LNGDAGEVVFGGRKILWKVTKTFRLPPRRPGRELFDADKVGRRVLLRHWQPGDRFQPIGMAHAVKLQDLFTNQRVSRAKRHELVVATTANNEVFWVEGLRMGERFKLTLDTKRCLKWRW
jgi:tRNA(Ile)-lysidine synthase